MAKTHKQVLKQLASARLRAKKTFRSSAQKSASRRDGQQHRRLMEK